MLVRINHGAGQNKELYALSTEEAAGRMKCTWICTACFHSLCSTGCFHICCAVEDLENPVCADG